MGIYILSKKTKIYTMNRKIIITLPKFTKVELVKNGVEVEVVVRFKSVIILFRRENVVVNGRRPIGVYLNGDLIALCNYANPPFPLSLLPP